MPFRFRRSFPRKYKKKPSSKISAIKNKAYRASARKNRNAISTVAKRLVRLERNTKFVVPKKYYYESPISPVYTVGNVALYGKVTQFIINNPNAMTPCFNYNDLIVEAPEAQHRSSRLFMTFTLKEAMLYPLTLNVAIVKYKKMAYSQTQTIGEQGEFVDWDNFVTGREITRDQRYTNGSQSLMFNPRYFKLVKHKRFSLKNNTGTGGFMPSTNEFNVNMKIPIRQTYKKKGGVGISQISKWTEILGADLLHQYYCFVWHEGYDESVHTDGISVQFDYVLRHTIKQRPMPNTITPS